MRSSTWMVLCLRQGGRTVSLTIQLPEFAYDSRKVR